MKFVFQLWVHWVLKYLLMEDKYLQRRIDLRKLSWNAGVGLTYASPLGPIRMDYAFQIDNPKSGMIQWGVLYAF